MTAQHDWFQSGVAARVLAWEQAELSQALVDVFGYHAMQLGLPQLQGLASNRMPHHWLVAVQAIPTGDGSDAATDPGGPADGGQDRGATSHAGGDAEAGAARPATRQVALACNSAALPFAANSIDLLVLPHTLEFSDDPHATLREVQRVLVPEGHVAITGFNPASLWGARHGIGRWFGTREFLPPMREWIAPWRLRDWLRLLDFEAGDTRYGNFSWPSARGAREGGEQPGVLDKLGARWWPILGATYCVMAVKRVGGAIMMDAWAERAQPVRASASIAGRVAVPQPSTRAEYTGAKNDRS